MFHNWVPRRAQDFPSFLGIHGSLGCVQVWWMETPALKFLNFHFLIYQKRIVSDMITS